MPKLAPWKDYAGNQIWEGDKIVHPSGETGTVVVTPHMSVDADRWLVDYGIIPLSRLCLQVGDKGQAVVEKVEVEG